MNYSCNELYLLGHTFGEVLNLLVPPLGKSQAIKPLVKFAGGVLAAHATHAGKEYCLFTYFHLLVEATLLGHITYLVYVIGSYFMVFKPDLTAIGYGHMIYHTYECGLTGSVGAEQTVNGATWDLH